MQQLITINNEDGGLVSVRGLEALNADIQSRIRTMSVIAVSPDNVKSQEAIRTENNAYIKGVEQAILDAQEAYLARFTEAVKPIQDALAPLKKATKDFADICLEAKKVAFKQEMLEWFYGFAKADPEGVLPDFEEIYDPKMYGMTKSDAKLKMATRIGEWRVRRKRTKAYLNIDCTLGELKEIKEFLTSKGISFNCESFEE